MGSLLKGLLSRLPPQNSALGKVLDLLVFLTLTFVIHFVYRYWAYNANYQVFGVKVFSLELLQSMSLAVFYQVKWILGDLLGIAIYTEGIVIYMPDGGGIAVTEGCSGLKQILQFALLILVLPGPWKHKLWFIPLGMIIMHLTNLVRIIGLSFVMMDNPSLFDGMHGYVFRPLFYAVIFGLWLYWNGVLRTNKATRVVK